MDRKHQVFCCAEHFFSRGVFIRHHCLSFCDGVFKHLPDRFYKAADGSVFHIAFCPVQEILQGLFARVLGSLSRSDCHFNGCCKPVLIAQPFLSQPCKLAFQRDLSVILSVKIRQIPRYADTDFSVARRNYHAVLEHSGERIRRRPNRHCHRHKLRHTVNDSAACLQACLCLFKLCFRL